MPAVNRFTSQAIAALPILNHYFLRLRLKTLFEEFLPPDTARLKVSSATGLMFLLRSVLLARGPLYGLQDWARQFDAGLLGFGSGEIELLNDDRAGRCLDRLFRTHRAALMTAVVLHAIRAFKLDMSELHNDSTTVTFTGEYEQANGASEQGQDTHRIVLGHNKDHRPDLKQLLWILSTTADGSVPIWCKVEHGNVTDDQTHVQTWDTLRQIVGKADFLYVADSKLCTKENMEHIAQRQGRFLTVLPGTRKEDGQFRDWIQTHEPQWQELLRKENARRSDAPEDIYRGFESPMRTVEGYRVLWILSSQKQHLDRAARQGRIKQATEALVDLQARIDSPRSRLRTRKKIEGEIHEIFNKTHARRWLEVEVSHEEQSRFRQATRGRPNADTRYIRTPRERFTLKWQSNADTLRYDSRTDGLFPLVLNDETLSLSEALRAYKHQPQLEKRHEQLKTVFAVMPVHLKNNLRVEALLFIYFLALLVEALIERDLRQAMQAQKVPSLPLYHEGRLCKAPTASLVFELFATVRKHGLFKANGSLQEEHFDSLNPPQKRVLGLLGMSSRAYFTPAIGQPSR